MGPLRHREKRLRQVMLVTAAAAGMFRKARSTVAKINRDLYGNSHVISTAGATPDSMLATIFGRRAMKNHGYFTLLPGAVVTLILACDGGFSAAMAPPPPSEVRTPIPQDPLD